MNFRITLFCLLICFTSQALALDEDGKKAPDFSLPTLDGETFRLSEQLGKGPVLLNFWATWCGPCLREMKKLKKVYQRHQDKGLQIVSISIDDQKTVSQVRGIVKSRRFPFTVLLDMNHEAKRLFQVANPPYTILLDKDGTIIYMHEGYREGDVISLEEKIISLMENKSE